MSAILQKTMKSVEDELGRFYDFQLLSNSSDHLIDRQQLGELKEEMNTPEVDRLRGSVIVSQESDELFIGIFFHEEIIARLEAADPTTEVSNQNLDAFSVLIEEISHFHLILNRVKATQTLSRLELEMQAEIDKLLVSGLFLERIAGHHHIDALKKLIFNRCTYQEDADGEAASAGLYPKASRLAHEFWNDLSEYFRREGIDLNDHELRKFMRFNYEKPLRQKELISSRPLRIV